MKNPLLFLALSCAVSLSARAVAPHPSVLTVRVDNKMVPVIHVVNTDPVVEIDGREKRIRTEPIYLVQHADRFGPGYVRVKNVSLSGMEIKMVATADEAQANTSGPSVGPRFGTSYFEATMTSKTDLKDAFVVLVIYPSITEMSAINEAEIVVHQLPELPAGVPVRVKITSPIANGGPALKHIVQVFDGGGHELATNWWDDCGKYYGMRDRMRLREQVEKYVAKNAGADRALVPVLQPRPILPEGADFPKAEGTAVLSVDATGLVSHVEVRGIEDKAVRESINNALGGWLFLPQLKAGQPVATKVKIPLQF